MNSSLFISKNLVILALGIGLSSSGFAQNKPAMVDPNKAPIAAAGVDEVFQLVDAVVTKVDSKTRTVTLKDKDGIIFAAARSVIFASKGKDYLEAAREEVTKLNDLINNARGISNWGRRSSI